MSRYCAKTKGIEDAILGALHGSPRKTFYVRSDDEGHLPDALGHHSVPPASYEWTPAPPMGDGYIFASLARKMASGDEANTDGDPAPNISIDDLSCVVPSRICSIQEECSAGFFCRFPVGAECSDESCEQSIGKCMPEACSEEFDCGRGFTCHAGTCIDIDECDLPNSCPTDAVCTNLAGAHSCQCPTGLTPGGDSCKEDLDLVCTATGFTQLRCLAYALGVTIVHDGPCEGAELSEAVSPCEESSDCNPNELCLPRSGQCSGGGFCQQRPVDENCGALDDDPVCGCDGVNYRNSCAAYASGSLVATSGICEGSCASAYDTGCAEDEYCSYTQGCGGGDEIGTCLPRPTSCSGEVAEPVCGCDQEQYQNECEAHLNGSSRYFGGQCENPVCPEYSFPVRSCGRYVPNETYFDNGCDAVSAGFEPGELLYSGGCKCPTSRCFIPTSEDILLSVEEDESSSPAPYCAGTYFYYCDSRTLQMTFGKEECVDEVNIAPDAACGLGMPCSAVSGLTCPGGTYCKNSTQCGENGQSGTCEIGSDHECADSLGAYDNVLYCGCDGKTHQRDTCNLHMFKSDILHSGACGICSDIAP